MAWKDVWLSLRHKSGRYISISKFECVKLMKKWNVSSKLTSHTIHRQKSNFCPGYHHVLTYLSFLT